MSIHILSTSTPTFCSDAKKAGAPITLKFYGFWHILALLSHFVKQLICMFYRLLYSYQLKEWVLVESFYVNQNVAYSN